MTSGTISLYRKHRFPPEIIADAVWLYRRFSLSFREVEELLAERGVIVSHEAVRPWCFKFGQAFAKKLRRRRGQPGDTWPLDELFIRIRGGRSYWWRAVDQDGQTLDILVQIRRNTSTATRFFRTSLKRLRYVPNRLVTDNLRSYGAAHRTTMPSVTHHTRQRERHMRRFTSLRHVQRFLSVHGPLNNLFRVGRHLLQAGHYRLFRDKAFATWRDLTTGGGKSRKDTRHPTSHYVIFVPCPDNLTVRYIHVHHIIPLGSVGVEYKVDGVRDLIPVCPNCHAMIHYTTPPLTIAELKDILSGEDAMRKDLLDSS